MPLRPTAPIPAAKSEGAAGSLTFREPVTMTVGPPGEQRELRKLTPEEKAQRRFRRNIVMLTLGIAMLIVTLLVLLQFSGE